MVYEYMPRGSLHFIIHGILNLILCFSCSIFFLNLPFKGLSVGAELRAGISLAWPKRFQIIEGIAQGVVYLHQHSRPRIVHGDLKPSNILLDSDMTPRIIDFGLAQVLSYEDEKDTGWVAGTL